MCLAIPARVISLKGPVGVARVHNVDREVRMDLVPDCKVGDYVLVHAGFAINRLDTAALEETRRAFESLSDAVSTAEGSADPPD